MGLLSLQEYERIALRFLSKYYPPYLKDNDVIGDIIYTLATADIKFNGLGNIYGYRSYRAYYKLLSIKYPKKRIRKEYLSCEPSIHAKVEKTTPLDLAIEREEGNLMLSRVNSLLPRYREFLTDYFYNDLTYQQIADKHGITRERVRQIINIALRKLKGKLDV